MTIDAPIVSIILPCFNVEKTIEWTINSVLSQSLTLFELICVDDQSTDETHNQLLEMAKSDNRIKVIRSPVNSGPGVSRNIGLAHASSDLVAFIDGDDFYEVDYLESLYDALIANDADIAQCKVRYIYNDRNHSYGSNPGVIKGEHCSYRIDLDDGMPFINPQVWNKLYKKTLFSQLEYKGICYEDSEILPALLARCKKIICIPDVLYNYNKRFSVLTGENKKELDKLPWYFNSQLVSIKPYISEQFLQKITKWGASPPRPATANLNNFLTSIVLTKNQYNQKESSSIHSMFLDFSIELLNMLPATYRSQNYKILDSFNSEMNFDNQLALLAKPYAITLKSNLSSRKLRLLGLLEIFIPIIDRWMAKDKNKWVFSSWGRYESHTLDNPRAVFETAKKMPEIKKIVLLNSDMPTIQIDNNDPTVSFYPLHSFSALFSLLTAGRIYTGYSLHDIFAYKKLTTHLNRKIIQLWHGIPVKKVGLQVKPSLEPHWTREAARYHATVASSIEDQEMMAASFSPGETDKVKLTGLPRHDFLALPANELPADYQQQLALIKNRLGGRKLMLFAPTWRYGNEKPCMFTPEQFAELDKLMSLHNSVLGVRLHPNMMKSKKFNAMITDNIIYFNDIADINILLRKADSVITDYSSLYLDFIKLKRPILLYTPDIEKYKSHRGFNYTAEEFVPHDFYITNFEQLIEKVSSVLADEFKIDQQYHAVSKRFHHFELDDQNSARVIHSLSKQSQS